MGAGNGGALTATSFASDPEQLKGAREDIKTLLAEKKAHGILVSGLLAQSLPYNLCRQAIEGLPNAV